MMGEILHYNPPCMTGTLEAVIKMSYLYLMTCSFVANLEVFVSFPF